MSSPRGLSTPSDAMEVAAVWVRRSCTSSFFSSSIRMATGYRDMLSCSMAFAGRAAASLCRRGRRPRRRGPTREDTWGEPGVPSPEYVGASATTIDSADASAPVILCQVDVHRDALGARRCGREVIAPVTLPSDEKRRQGRRGGSRPRRWPQVEEEGGEQHHCAILGTYANLGEGASERERR